MSTQNKVIVTVKRLTPIGKDYYFQVSWGSPIQYKYFSFRENEAEDSIYNEELNRNKAMVLAAKIENGNTDTEEIIYQTPTN